jgi:hypothetical protein
MKKLSIKEKKRDSNINSFSWLFQDVIIWRTRVTYSWLIWADEWTGSDSNGFILQEEGDELNKYMDENDGSCGMIFDSFSFEFIAKIKSLVQFQALFEMICISFFIKCPRKAFRTDINDQLHLWVTCIDKRIASFVT